MDRPNCITPWKCNGPHLFKVHDTLYRSEYGYFLLKKESNEYVFIPHEKEYSTDDLLDISDTLRNLNEKEKI